MNYFDRFGYGSPRLFLPTPNNLFLSVVIPCHNEPFVSKAIQSLFDCDLPQHGVEVIVVVNACLSANAEVQARNKKTVEEINKWKEKNSRIGFDVHLIEVADMPDKHGGVGLARKIGMDEAAFRFNEINKDGIIVCFDADCTCDKNYLVEIEKHFLQNNASAASVYFEHPLVGNEFDTAVYEAIVDYELFLRYYVQALRYAAYPYAYHTIGSSMAVRSSVYQKQGGMNKRKAGEDFYFLHKVIPLGNFIEINTTRVIPSPRPSDRVPFGTGKAVNKWLEKGDEQFSSYSLEIFSELKSLLKMLPLLFNNGITIYNELPVAVQAFVPQADFKIKLDEIKSNSSSYNAFVKRFYNWWDGFVVLKFVHFARDNFYPDVLLSESASVLCSIAEQQLSAKDLLLYFRELQRKSPPVADFS